MTTIPVTDRADYPVLSVSHYIVTTLPATLFWARRGRSACGLTIVEGQATIPDAPQCPDCSHHVMVEAAYAEHAEREHRARLAAADAERDRLFREALAARKATALAHLRRRSVAIQRGESW